MAEDNNGKQKALSLAVEQIEKAFGKGSIMRLGDGVITKVETIPTGSISLDAALGIGGIPRGRIVEIFGPESSGKTTLCLHIVAEAQKTGGMAAFVDAEHALDIGYARKIGVDVSNLLVSQPENGEQALEIVETLVRSNALDVVIIDSVAALVPKAEIDGEMGDPTMGTQARLMSQALRKLTSAISKSKTTVMFTNQLRSKIGIVFGNPETTTGGNALKFYASIRLDIRRKDVIKDGTGTIIGNHVKVKVVKNKLAPPFREVEFDIFYNEGISRIGDLLDVGVEANVIQKSGSWFSYENERLGQGREGVRKLLLENADLLARIETAVKKAIGIAANRAEESADDANPADTESGKAKKGK
ncbi:MAG: recombinase RecA [Ignavibacteria bacterium]|nr:recombinase RecA [Ignavibacteria bacterium]